MPCPAFRTSPLSFSLSHSQHLLAVSSGASNLILFYKLLSSRSLTWWLPFSQGCRRGQHHWTTTVCQVFHQSININPSSQGSLTLPGKWALLWLAHGQTASNTMPLSNPGLALKAPRIQCKEVKALKDFSDLDEIFLPWFSTQGWRRRWRKWGSQQGAIRLRSLGELGATSPGTASPGQSLPSPGVCTRAARPCTWAFCAADPTFPACCHASWAGESALLLSHLRCLPSRLLTCPR